MQRLIIGSKNLHKIREIRSMLKSLSNKIDILSLREFPEYQSPEERGDTFEENARTKALHAIESLDSLVLADDSGLVIPALGGLPGVRSSRFAGESATEKENRSKLIEMLKTIPEKERTGYFECCMVLASKKGIIKVSKGYCEGKLVIDEKGNNGFGYDPLFIKWDYNKTFAELEEDVKNRISHRRKALDKLVNTIELIVIESQKKTQQS